VCRPEVAAGAVEVLDRRIGVPDPDPMITRSVSSGKLRAGRQGYGFVRLLTGSPVSSPAEDHIDTAHHLGKVLWWQLGHALGEKGSIDGDDLRRICHRVLLKARGFAG